jgi:hypothetical protein
MRTVHRGVTGNSGFNGYRKAATCNPTVTGKHDAAGIHLMVSFTAVMTIYTPSAACYGNSAVGNICTSVTFIDPARRLIFMAFFITLNTVFLSGYILKYKQKPDRMITMPAWVCLRSWRFLL